MFLFTDIRENSDQSAPLVPSKTVEPPPYNSVAKPPPYNSVAHTSATGDWGYTYGYTNWSS